VTRRHPRRTHSLARSLARSHALVASEATLAALFNNGVFCRTASPLFDGHASCAKNDDRFPGRSPSDSSLSIPPFYSRNSTVVFALRASELTRQRRRRRRRGGKHAAKFPSSSEPTASPHAASCLSSSSPSSAPSEHARLVFFPGETAIKRRRRVLGGGQRGTKVGVQLSRGEGDTDPHPRWESNKVPLAAEQQLPPTRPSRRPGLLKRRDRSGRLREDRAQNSAKDTAAIHEWHPL